MPDQATGAARAHAAALLDWLACAVAGAPERAARAARAAADPGAAGTAAWLGTAGHVLDFDDTYLPGLVHLSAPTAAAALALAAALDATTGEVAAAHAAGFEAMAALARASHPGLYERGWHPTAVCGAAGAAVAAGTLLGLGGDARRDAAGLAALRSGGLRSAFGSDGKALQVGMAAADGVFAARAVAAGARVPHAPAVQGRDGFEAVLGGTWAEPGERPAVLDAWIKPWPCCLMAHSTIEAVLAVRSAGAVPPGPIEIAVHPRARQAAAYDDAATGLQAKFSIPYLAAFTLEHGAPGVDDLRAADPSARAFAKDRITVATDPGLGETEAVIRAGGEERARVRASLGSPARPLTAEALAPKVAALAGPRLDGALDDPARPARAVVAAVAEASA
jgi:2-methylcitrate dehydratase PrpD